jgi:hypothetical protein
MTKYNSKPLLYRIVSLFRDENITTTTPHEKRRTIVKLTILIPIAFMIWVWLSGCSPQRSGCYGTRGMSGYGWIKCKQSGKICVLRPDGSIVYSYYEPVK